MGLIESLRFPLLTSVAYWLWASMAMMVAAFALAHLFRKTRFPAGVWIWYVALALAWSGDGLNKVWFGIYRELGFPPWMLDSAPVLFISCLTITGAAIHIYTFTSHRVGHFGWIACLFISMVITFFIVSGPARAHGEYDWIMNNPQYQHCCGPTDCRHVDPRAIKFDGYGRFKIDGRSVPKDQTYISPVPGSHACFSDDALKEKPRCLFLPLMG